LVRKGRIDSGERRTVTPRLREAIEGLALEKPPLPLTSVHRQAKQFAHLVGEPAPSYWVVRDIVLSLPNDLRTLAQQYARSRTGNKNQALQKRVMPGLSRLRNAANLSSSAKLARHTAISACATGPPV
jgi:hypothetical protein